MPRFCVRSARTTFEPTSEVSRRDVTVDFSARLRRAFDGRRAARAIGSRMVTTVPPLSGQSSVSDPPCNSAVRLAMGSPKPPPLAFVVKNGSNTWFRMSAGMPGPLSRTSMRGKVTRTVPSVSEIRPVRPSPARR